MTVEDDTTREDAAADAAFDAGFASETPKPVETKPDKPPVKEKPEPAATPRVEAEPAPKFVQITEKDWNEVQAAARRTASYDGQFSKLFGTTGNLQKLIASVQGQTPTGRKVEIPKDAFAQMERDFPELAQQTRAALEAALSGMSGTGGAEVDASKIEERLAQWTSKREIEALEDQYPTWKEIVGAVDMRKGEQPNADNPFRKWLGTKDAAYQARVNNAESAAIIGRAIRTFQTETKAAAKPAPRDDARTERIRGAIQPRGDAQGAGAANSEQAEFEAGFNSR